MGKQSKAHFKQSFSFSKIDKKRHLHHFNQTPTWGHGMPEYPLRRSLSEVRLWLFMRPLNASDFLLSLTILGD
ncbi:hypothetical protein BCT15_07645 [Vibrio splendidus]|uniref:Uncharacterized protein n=1 Tax=Vibrio splendidus TaxID=29497 RepID=A0A2N7MJA6_VIBSP|nr:hypothetical protein BCT54_10250 [Vibrio splendidus]PMO24219.1 hypothetical protein BCT15_07645 [Vibrio splendidus]